MTEPHVKSQPQSWLERFIDRNQWSLIILIGGMIVFYTTINIRVNAMENDVQTLKELVQRVIVLEEQNKHEEEVLKEIKQNTKEIKEQMEKHLREN